MRPIIPRYRRNPLFRGVSYLSRLWLKAYENCNGDFYTNGEEMVLRSLAGAQMSTIFDVGANLGKWSKMAHRYQSTAQIFGFELSPPTYEILLNNTRDLFAIQIFNVGLADQAGEVEFYHLPHRPGETSMLKLPNEPGAVVLRNRVMTGDAFCDEHKVQNIDFLKIDVEGLESAVLGGFSRMLREGKIAIIQFEYQTLNVATRFLLQDFYRLLTGYGYAVGKIYPNYVHFRPYSPEQELEWASNYLAVLSSRVDLLERLPK